MYTSIKDVLGQVANYSIKLAPTLLPADFEKTLLKIHEKIASTREGKLAGQSLGVLEFPNAKEYTKWLKMTLMSIPEVIDWTLPPKGDKVTVPINMATLIDYIVLEGTIIDKLVQEQMTGYASENVSDKRP